MSVLVIIYEFGFALTCALALVACHAYGPRWTERVIARLLLLVVLWPIMWIAVLLVMTESDA
ncbi:MAG TPA: hypothetical protein VK524_08335 [Polyangiaceae bacterium]|nr:hypothetical protein [Polyangiaceae bacterium]